MQGEIRVIGASYLVENNEPVIEIFGRDINGDSYALLYKGFKPYFFVAEPTASELNYLNSISEKVSIEEKTLWLKGRDVNAVKFVCKSPWKVPEFRKGIQEQSRVLAADIPFHFRFYYDMDLGSCVKFEGEEIKDDRFTTDHVVNLTSISKTNDFKPPLKIMSFDIENSIKTQQLYVIGYTIKFKDKEKNGSITGEPTDILKRFIEVVRENDPDIITGYNIDGYDLPFLSDLAKNNNIKMQLSRDDQEPKRVQNQFWKINGRVVADAWWNVKREIHPKQETLAAVSKELLGESKLDVDRINIDNEWENNRNKVIEYCIKDSRLALLILEKIDVVDKYLNMSTVSLLPLDDVWNSGNSTLIDSLLIREADRRNIAVPMNNFTNQQEEKIEGGYVHTIEPGLYDMVAVLDFKSMYPSLMIKHNICFTTLSPNGTIVAPNGVRFLAPEVKKGLVPEKLQELMKTRDMYKSMMKNEKNEDRKRYLNSMQNSVKILMNSFYGVFASNFYRFTDQNIGAAITAFARETIKGIIRDLESRGIKVVYGDTDSIFIKTEKKTLEEALKLAFQIRDEISNKLGIQLEVERILDPMFSHGAKKRYAGRIIYPEQEKGNIIVRGYEIRRTDSFDLQSEALMEIFNHILDRDVTGALRRAKQIIQDVKSGNVDIEKLVISRSVKDFDTYKDADSLANVQAARKLQEMGMEFVPGMKVSWIVTDSKKRPQEVEPYIPSIPFKKKPDYEYYADRVAQTLARITEVFNMDEISLKSNEVRKKSTLEDFL
ncbi:MAG: DNA polymerase domain-containing protein [Thermoplasmatales archaeon]